VSKPSSVPLPEKVVIDRHLPTGVAIYGYSAAQLAAYGDMRAAEERERCAEICEAVATAHGGVAEGPIAAERGKLVHEAMAAGATHCAHAIRQQEQEPHA